MLSENEFVTKYNLSEFDINNQKLLYKSYKKKMTTLSNIIKSQRNKILNNKTINSNRLLSYNEYLDIMNNNFDQTVIATFTDADKRQSYKNYLKNEDIVNNIISIETEINDGSRFCSSKYGKSSCRIFTVIGYVPYIYNSNEYNQKCSILEQCIVHFPCTEDKICFGRYEGNKPQDAARKAFTRLSNKFNLIPTKKYQFAIKEITPGSNSNVYKYIGFKKESAKHNKTQTFKSGKTVNFKYRPVANKDNSNINY
jgi:hypothetical protein